MTNNSGKKRFSTIRKLDKWLLSIENAVAGTFYVAMMIIVFIGVILRYVTHTSNLYGEEMSRYLMVACVFIGIAAGCRQKVHLNVTMFVNHFPAKVKLVINLIVRAIVAFTYGFMAYQGFLMVKQMKGFGQISPAMRIPLWIMYVVITAGFALSAITEVVMYIDEFVFKGEMLSELEEVEES